MPAPLFRVTYKAVPFAKGTEIQLIALTHDAAVALTRPSPSRRGLKYRSAGRENDVP